jgi:pullulanase/glycogen debranching enzyme
MMFKPGSGFAQAARWCGPVALVCAGLLSPAARADDGLLAACNMASHAQVLRADARRHEARAITLDARTLQWPGAPEAGRYRLLWSAAGGLQAAVGELATGSQADWLMQPAAAPMLAAQATRFAHVAAGVRLQLPALDAVRLHELYRGQLLLVREDAQGRVQQATGLQLAGALDDLYAAAEAVPDLGLQISPGAKAAARVKLWAPTAQSVALCRYANDTAAASAVTSLARDDATGVWQSPLAGDARGGYYTYLVDVWVPGTGLVRQRVTDPYATSLGTDSRRTWIGSLDAPATQPMGWAQAARPQPLKSPTDMVVYELHVRDFSISDASVPEAQRGKYAAFAQGGSRGMQHLQALARAGLTDVHLLPVFDIASVPEQGCVSPKVPQAAANSDAQQAAVMAVAATDCFNWGYDPLHFNAPEGSYSSTPGDGAVRVREFRQMVMALHRAGLRVGMDVVYNHLSASGQHRQSVLDRIVPGYYHRLNAAGEVERSTCCDNSATEHRMMGKLMLDSVRLWARQYRIDSFRFDLMGHQPRAAMEQLKALLRTDNARDIQLIGEGWNFGEVANGARFVQASQLSLNGSGIGTFSDRGRDALRGGGAGDGPDTIVQRQGYLNGLAYDPNEGQPAQGAPDQAQLKATADLVRLGLAGTLRSYKLTTASGEVKTGQQMRYADQPAGYASEPSEVVNYVENHDNHTLWDVNAYKLPLATPPMERARVQVLGLAFVAFSQGVAYFHAGMDVLRSKSLDGNSYDSGDWFNRLDWTGATNHFGTGLPPAQDNKAFYALAAPRLADARLHAGPAEINFARNAFLDLLRIRASSALLRLPTAALINQRLKFHNTGPIQNPVLIAAELDGGGLPDAGFARLMVLINVDKQAHALQIDTTRDQAWALHPVHLAAGAADARPATESRFDMATGRFSLPARTAMVYVLR